MIKIHLLLAIAWI